MADLSDIQKKIRDEFADRARNDTKLSEIRKKIQEGADYRIAERYAERSGQILSEVLRSNITSENFPVGSVEEIAGLIIPPMEQNHHLVGNATAKVQKALNSKSNLGLKPVIPEFDRKAGMHMAGRMAQYESFEEAEWMLDEPIVTDSISHVDEMLRENADMQYKAGLHPKIIRTAESGCCEWCASLEGEYDYAEVADKGNPVYQRHNNCRCEVTYDPGSGKVQDVWSKAEFDKNSSKEDRASAIRSKEIQLARREETKSEARIKKAEATARVMEVLGYSPKGASIWYNAHKADIEKYGLEYMLDYTANQSELIGFYEKEYAEKKVIPEEELPEKSFDEIKTMANEMLDVANQYNQSESVWTGKISYNRNGAGLNPYTHDIDTNGHMNYHVILHEILHSKSAGHYDRPTYYAHMLEEELSVQFLTQEISRKIGLVEVTGGYENAVNELRSINKDYALFKTDYDFAMALYNTDMRERDTSLRELMREVAEERGMSDKDLSVALGRIWRVFHEIPRGRT